jgi:hypothetical protein
MREIDVLYDLAFLLMDLDFRGLRPMANRVLNAWLDEAAHAFDGSAWKGLRALPLFQSVRAAVRAHVTAREGDIGRARRYLRAAHGYLAEFRPVLVAVGGLSGSGKTTYARSVAPALGGAPGAVILRSDEVRKRLWGRAPTQKLPQAAYTEEATAAVYAEVFAIASRCLAAGRAVVIDAVFLEAAQRALAEQVAAKGGVVFEGVWLEAPLEILKDRLARRSGDASDADLAVLDHQLASDPGAIAWRRRPSPDLAR